MKFMFDFIFIQVSKPTIQIQTQGVALYSAIGTQGYGCSSAFVKVRCSPFVQGHLANFIKA
jgi:hypothetical protein